MSLTADQRSELSRKNGRQSRGPTTPEGKDQSRRNALKHGPRAAARALPNEDPAAVHARERAWNDYYRPQSPAAQHLVNQCVQATLLADRCHRHHAEVVARQVRTAPELWDRARDDQLQRLGAGRGADPAAAPRLLRRSAPGCRRLIARREQLDAALEARGGWSPVEGTEAIRLPGHRAGWGTSGAPPRRSG